MQWAKYGGFSIENTVDGAVVDRCLNGDDSGPGPTWAQPYPPRRARPGWQAGKMTRADRTPSSM